MDKPIIYQMLPRLWCNTNEKLHKSGTVEENGTGRFKDVDKAKETAAKEWSDFITTATTKGADTATPPGNNGGTKSTAMADIYKRDEHGRYIMTAEQRQKAIMDNLNNKGA